MTPNVELAALAVEAVAGIDGVFMSPELLAEDALLLTCAFPAEADFGAACANTCRALSALVSRQVSASALKYQLEGWQSYHYQHKVGQGAKADCRIMFKYTDYGIEVLGFGHRRIPADFYARMSASRSK